MNGASAVACTSTMRPSPVMTTFMSTSAVESSVYPRSSNGCPSTIPTETAATESVSTRLSPNRSSARAAAMRTADRRATGAAVGLEHVAIEPDRSFAQRLEVDDRAKRPADQSLDLDRPAALPSPRSLALRAFTRRRRGESTRPSSSRARCSSATADLLLNRRSAQHLRLPLRVEDSRVRLLEVVDLDRDRPQLVGSAAFPHAATRASSASSTCSTAAIGSCRKRAPVARKIFGSPVVTNR